VVAELCDRVAIMQGGRIVEQGPVGQVLSTPRHGYTAELLAAVPRLGTDQAATAAPPVLPAPPPQSDRPPTAAPGAPPAPSPADGEVPG
jgi:ABC-type dipeptide/oligopeptide/nickel transport system ATPase component